MEKKYKVLIICLSAGMLLAVGFNVFFNSKWYIKLNGDSYIEIGYNTEYIDMGATDIFNMTKINSTNNVNTGKLGTYTVTYKHGLGTRERTIKVIDLTPPEIILEGLSEVNLVLNSEYVEPGFKCIDEIDGELTDKVITTNSIDNKTVGTYEVIYNAKDNSNNEIELKRIVNVQNKGPLSMNLKQFSLNGYFTSTILKETEDMGADYLNETVFFGDSITDNMAYYKNLPYNLVWAIDSITPETAQTTKANIYKTKEKLTLYEATKKYKPKRLVITLGANAVAIMTETYFINQYEKLVTKVQELSPDTQIIVQSIFPVDSRWDAGYLLNNTKINRLNYKLASMCEKLGVKFLNTAEVLKNSSGQAIKGYLYTSDGIHPVPNANKVIIKYFRTHAYQ